MYLRVLSARQSWKNLFLVPPSINQNLCKNRKSFFRAFLGLMEFSLPYVVNYVRPNRSKHIVPYRFRCVKHFFKKRENRYLVRFSPGHFPDISRTFPGHFIPVQAVFGCICAVFSLLRTIFAMCP